MFHKVYENAFLKPEFIRPLDYYMIHFVQLCVIWLVTSNSKWQMLRITLNFWSFCLPRFCWVRPERNKLLLPTIQCGGVDGEGGAVIQNRTISLWPWETDAHTVITELTLFQSPSLKDCWEAGRKHQLPSREDATALQAIMFSMWFYKSACCCSSKCRDVSPIKTHFLWTWGNNK